MGIVQTAANVGSIRHQTFTVTAAGDGSVPTVTLPPIEGRLLSLKTVPGSPVPSNNFAVWLMDESGHDILEGVGQARSAGSVQKAPILFSGLSVNQIVDESNTLTFRVSDNSVANAQLVAVLEWALGA